MFFRLVTVGLVACLIASCENGDSAMSGLPEPPRGKLPETAEPLAYELELRVNPSAEGFSGRVRIETQLEESTDLIWLHGRDLDVTRARVQIGDGESLAARWRQVTDAGVAALTLPREVAPQVISIEIEYEADYFDGLKGLYRVREDGLSYLFTQFEPLAARLMFPGFDEPRFKVPFQLDLVVPERSRAVSNTPVARKLPAEEGWRRLKFEPTPPLPTYLVTIAVGPFDVVNFGSIPPTETRPREVPLRGIAVQGKGGQMAYALRHTGALLSELEEYIGRGYPYRKLDLLAVPDFAAGAMEHPGAMTFREELLLLDDDNAPIRQRRRFAIVMAHELAHQWFGNLVTMPWWDDLWLNESFATWLSYRAVDQWRPDFKARFSFVDRVRGAMAADELAGARRVREPVNDVHDIENAFDGITYSKGASVLSMFESYLGDEQFREIARRHIDTHANDTATLDEFLASVSMVADREAASAFRSFLTQPGIPSLEVALDCSDAVTMTFRQSRYKPLGSAIEGDTTWGLPVCYRASGDETRTCRLLRGPEATQRLERSECPAWLMPNARGRGYYHWSFAGSMDERLPDDLSQLTPHERLSVANSVRAAFRSGTADAREVLAMLKRLGRSDAPDVALSPLPVLKLIAEHLHPPDDQLGHYVDRLYGDVELAQPFRKPREEGTDTDRLFRADLVEFLTLTLDDPELRAAAGEAARRYLPEGRSTPVADAIDPNLADIVLVIGVQEHGRPFYERLERAFRQTDDPIFRRWALEALARPGEPALAERARELVFDPDLRRSEIRTFLAAHFSEPSQRDNGWQWLRDNFARLAERIPPGHGKNLPGVLEGFCSAERAEEIGDFLGPRLEGFPGAPRELEAATARIGICSAIRDHYESSMGEALDSFRSE